MDFATSPETTAKIAEVVDFARSELAGDLVASDHDCEFARENWQRCADFGVMGWSVPPQYGGSGHDMVTTVQLLEALGYGCADNGLTFAVCSQMWSVQPAILHFGSDDQIRKYIPPLINGGCGAFGITEAQAGSDTFSLQATATPAPGGYVLNGIKKYVTLAPEADVAVVFANSRPEVGRWGVTAFLVERGTAGFRTSPTQPKMGLRTTPFGDMILEDCFVSEDQRLGPEGAGASIFTTAMHSERGYIFASQLGVMRRLIDQALEHARTRQQFGQPIGKNQAVSHRIVDMKLRHELATLILYKVAWLDDQGSADAATASLAKLYLSESMVESSLDALRTHGALGYVTDHEVEREVRDGIGGLIYSGTSDIQRNIVARLLGL